MSNIIIKKIHNSSLTIDKLKKITVVKSCANTSRSFVTVDFSDKHTWFYDSIKEEDEIATTSDNITYNFASGRKVIDLDTITDRIDYMDKGVTVTLNNEDVTNLVTIAPRSGTVTFENANDPEDVVKVSYNYANTSKYELVSIAGKKLLLSYSETQFSVGTVFNDSLVFELILNNPNVGNVDYVAGYTEYKTAADVLNKANNGSIIRAFGELTKDVNIFPWNYLDGYTIKPIGDATTDPTAGEFNKLRLYLKNDLPYTECEVATVTFYCNSEDI